MDLSFGRVFTRLRVMTYLYLPYRHHTVFLQEHRSRGAGCRRMLEFLHLRQPECIHCASGRDRHIFFPIDRKRHGSGIDSASHLKMP